MGDETATQQRCVLPGPIIDSPAACAFEAIVIVSMQETIDTLHCLALICRSHNTVEINVLRSIEKLFQYMHKVTACLLKVLQMS